MKRGTKSKKRGTKSKKRGTKRGTDLAKQMANDAEFVKRTEQGWEDVEAGRVTNLGHTIVGVLAHSCNIYRK